MPSLTQRKARNKRSGCQHYHNFRTANQARKRKKQSAISNQQSKNQSNKQTMMDNSSRSQQQQSTMKKRYSLQRLGNLLSGRKARKEPQEMANMTFQEKLLLKEQSLLDGEIKTMKHECRRSSNRVFYWVYLLRQSRFETTTILRWGLSFARAKKHPERCQKE